MRSKINEKKSIKIKSRYEYVPRQSRSTSNTLASLAAMKALRGPYAAVTAVTRAVLSDVVDVILTVSSSPCPYGNVVALRSKLAMSAPPPSLALVCG